MDNIEIERKFLVTSKAYRECATSSKRIRQAYVISDQERVLRVRICGDEAFITVKISSAAGMSRFEWEKAIGMDDAFALLSQALPGVIDKERFIVPCEGHIWEVDEFYGDNQGLVVAEVELSSEDEPLSIPQWVGREVTSDPSYLNSSLASFPYSKWNEDSKSK